MSLDFCLITILWGAEDISNMHCLMLKVHISRFQLFIWCLTAGTTQKLINQLIQRYLANVFQSSCINYKFTIYFWDHKIFQVLRTFPYKTKSEVLIYVVSRQQLVNAMMREGIELLAVQVKHGKSRLFRLNYLSQD